jgi:hypothetical protein
MQAINFDLDSSKIARRIWDTRRVMLSCTLEQHQTPHWYLFSGKIQKMMAPLG